MSLGRHILPVAIALALVGCATAYKPSRWWRGGYSETALSVDAWRVRFEGNEQTDMERAMDFATLRSAELCEGDGYTHFDILRSETQVIFGEDEETEIVVNEDGDEEEITTGYTTTEIPVAIYEVRCVNPVGSPPETLEASFVMRSIKSKYGI